MQATYAHQKLGLAKFKTYEPYLLAAFEDLDKNLESRFVVTGIAPSTLAARLRDTIAGFRINRSAWQDAIEPRFLALFLKYDNQFVIRGPDEQNNVWLAFKRYRPGLTPPSASEVTGEIRRYQTIVKPFIRPSAPTEHRANSKDNKVIEAFVTLICSGEITNPVIFSGKIDSDYQVSLTNSHDIAFYYDPLRDVTVLT